MLTLARLAMVDTYAKHILVSWMMGVLKLDLCWC